jgi:hypothetical protein
MHEYDYRQNNGPRCLCGHYRYIHQGLFPPKHCNYGHGCSCELFRAPVTFLDQLQINGIRAALTHVVNLGPWRDVSDGRGGRYWR